jgi:hypothetical protein
MPGIDDLVDGLAGGGSNIDALVDGLAGDSGPEAEMTVGEPEVIKTETPKARDAGSWWESLARGALPPRQDAAQRGLEGAKDSGISPLSPEDAKALESGRNALSASGYMNVGPDGVEVMPDPVRALGGAGLNWAGNAAMGAAAPLARGTMLEAVKESGPALAQLAAGGGLSGAGASVLSGADSAVDVAKGAATGAGIGAVAPVLAQGLGNVAEAAAKKANELRTHVFMNPAQRAAYRAAKGNDALAALGQSAKDAGLLKGGILPPTAARVRDNAERVMAESGAGIGSFEDDLVKRGVNADVDVRPIGDDLRQTAEFLEKRATSASPAQAEAFRREAAAVQPMETRRMFRPAERPAEQMSLPGMEAPPPAPAAPVVEPEQIPLNFEPPAQMSLPLEAPAPAPIAPPAPAPAPIAAAPAPVQPELPGVPPARAPEPYSEYQAQRSSRSFPEAIADKRQLQNEVKWNQSAMQDSMGGAAAKKTSWTQHAQQIDAALDAAAARGEIAPETLSGYRENMKNFSTAATAFDPAMRMAERQGQVGLSGTDLMTGMALGGGADGGLAMMANKAGRGRLPGLGAAAMDRTANAAQSVSNVTAAAGRAVPAIAAAQEQNPGASKSDIERDANKTTKAALKGWWQHLTGK